MGTTGFISVGGKASCRKEDLSALAGHLIDAGNIYFCAWGPACEIAHDAFDEARRQKETQHVIPTTWHENEPLEEALWYVLFTATAEDVQRDGCSTVILTVGNGRWRDEVAQNLSDIAAFNTRLLANEPD